MEPVFRQWEDDSINNRVSLLLATVLFAACSDAPRVPTDTPWDDPAPALPVPAGTQVNYALRWDWEGARVDGTERTFTTRDGTEIRLSHAYLSTVSMELIPCPQEQASNTTSSGWFFKLQDFLAGTAHAAHGRTQDQSYFSRVESFDLLAPPPEVYGHSFTSGADYCQIHWLAAAVDMPPLEGQTVQLLGEFRTAGSAVWKTFVVSASLATAALERIDMPAQFSGEALSVTMTLHPAFAFDGIEFETLSDVELAYEFLKGLGRSGRAQVLPL